MYIVRPGESNIPNFLIRGTSENEASSITHFRALPTGIGSNRKQQGLLHCLGKVQQEYHFLAPGPLPDSLTVPMSGLVFALNLHTGVETPLLYEDVLGASWDRQGRSLCVQLAGGEGRPGEGDVYLLDVIQQDYKKVLAGPTVGLWPAKYHEQWNDRPVLSPSGEYIAFCSPNGAAEAYVNEGPESGSSLWLYEIASGALRRLTELEGPYDVEPTWAPGSDAIAICRRPGDLSSDDAYIVWLDLSGKELGRVVTPPTEDNLGTPHTLGYLSWHPTQDLLLGVTTERWSLKGGKLALLSMKNGRLLILSNDDRYYCSPVWVLEGEAIAYLVRSPGQAYQVELMNTPH